MKAALPANFDLNRHINAYPPDRSFSPFEPDKALYILSQITLIPARNKVIANNIADGFTPLNAQKLQQVVRLYHLYLTYFLTTGIIETDSKYYSQTEASPGKSRGYRFAEPFSEQPIIPVAYSPGFIRVLTKRLRGDYEELKKEYKHLTKWLWPNCQLQIDEEMAVQFLEVRRQAQKLNSALLDRKKNTKKKNTKLSFSEQTKPEWKDPDLQYNYARVSVDNIQAGNLGCTVDETVGRMHTMLTGMKSDLRNLITFAGKPMVSIDIANSQPYLAIALTNPAYKAQMPEGAGGITPSDDTNPQEINQNKPIHPPILVGIKELPDSEDFRVYRALVSLQGYEGLGLYEYMERECSKSGISFANRGEVKEGIFEVLFSKNGHGSKAKKLFKKLFPSVDQFFRAIKAENHALLPILLQRIESDVVLKNITKKIGTSHPRIPLFTIHDSIATPTEYADLVERVMTRELTKLTGLPPRLKRDYWLPENLDWARYGPEGPVSVAG